MSKSCTLCGSCVRYCYGYVRYLVDAVTVCHLYLYCWICGVFRWVCVPTFQWKSLFVSQETSYGSVIDDALYDIFICGFLMYLFGWLLDFLLTCCNLLGSKCVYHFFRSVLTSIKIFWDYKRMLRTINKICHICYLSKCYILFLYVHAWQLQSMKAW